MVMRIWLGAEIDQSRQRAESSGEITPEQVDRFKALQHTAASVVLSHAEKQEMGDLNARSTSLGERRRNRNTSSTRVDGSKVTSTSNG